MREIKYRAWDKNKKIMFMPSSELHLMLTTRLGTSICQFFNNESDDNSISGAYELMQYTGLKDKNGKEIYEGDIIADGTTSYREAIVEYKAPNFYFKQTIGKNKPYRIDWSNFEVIGNIYENPELVPLEDEK